MFNFLINATKNRIILELKDVLSKHPAYKDLEIFNRFPYTERIQEGIVVKNSSANRMPLSADNFQGTVYSIVTFGKNKHNKGLSLEWVKEDEAHLTSWMYLQDFSPQIPSGYTGIETLIINLDEHMLKGGRNLKYADSLKDLEVYVNNSRVVPIYVDGKNKKIGLSPILPNSSIEISYWVRNTAAPGVYQVEITDGDPILNKWEFMVDALLDKEDILITKALGTETSFQTKHRPIYKGSLKLRENEHLMEELREDNSNAATADYIVDYTTGIITLIKIPYPVLRNASVRANYRVKGLSTGPFKIPNANYAHNQAIPGVILAFGRGISLGDKHYIVIHKDREIAALEYSGKWETAISLDVYAKDSVKVEEIIDITTSYLNTYRKEQLDAEGIYLVDVSFGGESEEIFDESTGDLQYLGSVEYNFLTEWIMHKPVLQTIEGYTINAEVIVSAEPFVPDRNIQFERIR